MADHRKRIPPYLQRGLLALIIVLLGISVARLLVSMHQQQERIEILEGQVAQLFADTTRLVLPSYSSRPYEDRRFKNQTSSRNDYYPRRNSYQNSSANRQVADSSTSSYTTNQRQETLDATPPTTSPSRKFTETHQFDLNTIDSATLVRIPGIAERTATVILKNRQRYGGFYSSSQLQEFLTWEAAQAYMEEWCTIWFTTDIAHIRAIQINTASVSELQRHPYISHEQAIDLVRYRTRHKHISSVAELQQLSTFSESQLNQLLPYLSFE